jgi:DNA modification methylase
LQADGWYLRQDIIWHKPNPMPESVQDRCTKAHEYIFLLTKSAKYYYDHEAIKTPASSSFAKDKRHITGSNDNHDKPDFAASGAQDSKGPHRMFGKSGNKERKQRPGAEVLNIGAQAGSVPWEGMTANRRSVWTVTTKPYKGAHFATFPSDLITPCILAGAPAGGIVLDPFMGSGTTAAVAIANGRDYLGCELNSAYKELQDDRIRDAHLGIAQMELI